MYQVTAFGPRALIEHAGNILSDMDPTPAGAVDMKEDTRTRWRLDAYAEDLDAAAGCVGILELIAPELEPSFHKLEDMDWVAMSLEGLPVVAAGPFLVGGAHALARVPYAKTSVWIEAGPAFGTGHHGTTLGCLRAMRDVLSRKSVRTCLDVGTGSGVLAIAAALQSQTRGLGTDIDRASVRVAQENAKNNKVATLVSFLDANGTRSTQVQTGAPYDLVVANILAKPLIRLSGDMARLMKPGGTIILSGLLTHQEPLVRQAYLGQGLTLSDRHRIDGWSTLVFTRPQPRSRLDARARRRSSRRDPAGSSPVTRA